MPAGQSGILFNLAGDFVAVRLFSPDREIHHGLRIAPMNSFDDHRR